MNTGEENFTIVKTGKETDHFSQETIKTFIGEFFSDIQNAKKKRKFYKGAVAFKEIENLENKVVNVWVEWNAKRMGTTGLDIGITNLIYYPPGTIPDVVMDRYNKFQNGEMGGENA